MDLRTTSRRHRHHLGYSTPSPPRCPHDAPSYHLASPRKIRGYTQTNRLRIVVDDTFLHLSSHRKYYFSSRGQCSHLINDVPAFQHSFLIVTLSSGIIAALPDLIKNPTSVPNILAQNLPLSSTFFLTYVLCLFIAVVSGAHSLADVRYVILQGLAGTAGGFLQIIPLLIHYVKLFILGSTPRAVYGIKYGLRNVAWGTTFPGVTLLVVISKNQQIPSLCRHG